MCFSGPCSKLDALHNETQVTSSFKTWSWINIVLFCNILIGLFPTMVKGILKMRWRLMRNRSPPNCGIHLLRSSINGRYSSQSKYSTALISLVPFLLLGNLFFQYKLWITEFSQWVFLSVGGSGCSHFDTALPLALSIRVCRLGS